MISSVHRIQKCVFQRVTRPILAMNRTSRCKNVTQCSISTWMSWPERRRGSKLSPVGHHVISRHISMYQAGSRSERKVNNMGHLNPLLYAITRSHGHAMAIHVYDQVNVQYGPSQTSLAYNMTGLLAYGLAISWPMNAVHNT